MLKVILVIAVMYCSSSEDIQQVINRETICLNDTAIFTCSNEEDRFAFWDVKSGSRIVYSLSLNHQDPVGRLFNESLGLSSLITGVTFINSTFITSTMTIIGITNLIGKSLVCNQYNITIRDIASLQDEHLPKHIILRPVDFHNSIIDFKITWTPASPNFEVNVIFSPPVCGNTAKLIADATTAISLKINTVYDVNISTCPDTIAHSFTIGRCPFILNSSTQYVMHYNISSTGNVSALTVCTESEQKQQYTSVCEEDGRWNQESASTCSLFGMTETSKLFTGGNISITTDEVKEENTSREFLIMITVIVIVAIGTGILCLIIGILLGLLCGAKYMKTKITNTKDNLNTFTEQEKSTTSPVYEELELKEEPAFVTLTENVCYA